MGSCCASWCSASLAGKRIVVIEPTAQPFPDAATTAAITAFEIEARPTSVYFRRVESLSKLGSLKGGRRIRRERLEAEARWSHFTRVSKQNSGQPPEPR